MLITYYETLIAVPTSDDMHSYHDVAKQFMQDVEGVVFSVIQNDHKFSTLRLRSEKPIGLPSETKMTLDIAEGQEICVSCLIAPLTSQRKREGEYARPNSTKEIPEDRIKPWLVGALLNKGMTSSVEDIHSTESVNFLVRKPNFKPFYFPVRKVFATCQIESIEQFKEAFFKGIGKRRTYGVGVIDVIKMDDV